MEPGNMVPDTTTEPNSSEPGDVITASTAGKEDIRRQRQTIIGISVGILFVLAIIIGAIIYLAQPNAPTEKIRDIFIIFMALEFLLIGLALVILIIQLASLINLLQNEVKPILESTNETASTLRGTAVFLSENLTEPVIQLNSYLAALRRMIELIGLARGPKRE
jgi:hypothetical protein